MASPSEPKRQPHGHLVNCPGGYRAFVPAPLPPPLAWEQELTINLSSADRAVGRLAGEGRRLPNPHILMRPFVRKEAVLSSRIEGTGRPWASCWPPRPERPWSEALPTCGRWATT